MSQQLFEKGFVGFTKSAHVLKSVFSTQEFMQAWMSALDAFNAVLASRKSFSARLCGAVSPDGDVLIVNQPISGFRYKQIDWPERAGWKLLIGEGGLYEALIQIERGV